MAERKFSELTAAAVLTDADILAISQIDSATASLMSKRTTLIAIANKFASLTNYTSELTTQDKTLTGAINELKGLISLIPHFGIEVVQTLPTEDISETTIYMTPSQNPQTQDAYDEFIYVNNAWEHVGSTAVDLSAYYTKLEVDGLLATKANTADVSAALALKANTSGTYPGIAAGKAVMNTYDSLGNYDGIYTERVIPAAGAEKLVLEKIQGATINWNQLVKNGRGSITLDQVTFTKNSDGSISVSGTASGSLATTQRAFDDTADRPNLIKDHVYYFGEIIGTNLTVRITTNPAVDITTKGIFKASADYTNVNISMMIYTGDTVSAKVYPDLVDLTATFGTAIANYINTLETAEAGSGIAWLKSQGYDLTNYHAFNAGSLESVEVAGHKITGKNLINGESVYADYKIAQNSFQSTTSQFTNVKIYLGDFIGKKITFSVYISSLEGFNRVYAQGNINGSNVDGNGITSSGKTSVTVTPTSSSDYVRLTYGSTAGTIDIKWKDVQVEVGEESTDYAPYLSPLEYPTGHDEIGGVLGLSEDYKIKIVVGDEYAPDGTITRNTPKRVYQTNDEKLMDTITDGTNTVSAFLGSIYDSAGTVANGSTGMTVTILSTDSVEVIGTTGSSYPSSKQLLSSYNLVNGKKYRMGAKATYSSGDARITIRNTANNIVSSYAYTESGEYGYFDFVYNSSTMNYISMFANFNAQGGDVIYSDITLAEFVEQTTEQGTPYQAIQTVEAGGTEAWEDYGVQQGTRDIAIPPMAYEEFYEEGSTTVTADIPALPMIDGRYNLGMTIRNGTPTLDWVFIQEASTESTESAGNGNRSLSLMKSATIETKEEETTEAEAETEEETKNENASESK